MNTLKALIVALIAITLAGCASTGSPTSSAAESSAAKPSSSEAASSQPPARGDDAPDGIPETVWAALLADLTQRLDEPVAVPDVVTAEAMTFNDGSLGCPQPEQAYTQALVDGYQIVVEVDGDRYDYRSPGGDSVRLCEGVIEGGG